ncbi:hypothetical protein BJV82DRAFT_584469 [Fennellomyces sp. T-0311]|nr:hypothetical protein BJV82DRAFT_584469 [Fennellomyces sp. T-0311]
MEHLYKLGNDLLHGTEGEKEEDAEKEDEDIFMEISMHNIQNAFWKLPQPFFDLHGSLLVDDLHQLGGVYEHLLNCLDKLIMDVNGTKGASIIEEINNRASMIPQYKDHRRFNQGIFPRFLRNPTYTEWRSNMAIILPCCYDYIPLQAALCLRHFLDFVMHATAEEHTEDSLTEMEESLDAYYKYSPIFQKYSPSGLNFPKNHMLQKYAHDIRSRGIIRGYSTTSSEHQHTIDVKKPAKRTNGRFDSLSQMANFIQKKDLLFDVAINQSSTLTTSLRAKVTISKIISRRSQLSYKLASETDPKEVSVLSQQGTFHGLSIILRSFFHTTIDNNFARVALRNLPQLDDDTIKVYQTLIVEDCDTNGKVIIDKIRTHDQFHGRERKDFAVFEFPNIKDRSDKEIYESYGQVLMVFRAKYRGREYDLVLARRYCPLGEAHKTGLEVISPDLDDTYKGLFISQIERVKRTIHVVPDYDSDAFVDPVLGSMYGKYLLNHDSDRFSWCNSRGRLPHINERSKEFVHWNKEYDSPKQVGTEDDDA